MPRRKLEVNAYYVLKITNIAQIAYSECANSLHVSSYSFLFIVSTLRTFMLVKKKKKEMFIRSLVIKLLNFIQETLELN